MPEFNCDVITPTNCHILRQETSVRSWFLSFAN